MARREGGHGTRLRIAPGTSELSSAIMEVDAGHDLISELPDDISVAILTKLPIKDAVRTCILARSWRYKWTSMTSVTFDDRIVTNRHKKPFGVAINRFINGFMSAHDGPIHKFKLSSKHVSRFLELDRLYRSLSRRDVKEFSVTLYYRPFFPASPSIFSCSKLTSLELYFCVLRPPQGFTGFLFMKHLVLYEVDISCEDLERLISICPLLTSLSVGHYGDYELTIRAPHLEHLVVRGAFRDIRLENTPLLAALTVYVRWVSDMHLEKFLSHVPKLKWLYMQNYFERPIPAGNGCRKFISFDFLKRIELSALSFCNPEEVLTGLKLIVSSPSLQELYIRDYNPENYDIEDLGLDYFNDPSLANRTLNSLKLVQITGDANEPVSTKLIEFLLGCSPSLVKMVIKQRRDKRINRRETLVKLSSFRKASPKALIVFAKA